MFIVGSHAAELRGLPTRRPTWDRDIDIYGSEAQVEALKQHLVQTEGARLGGSGNGRWLIYRDGWNLVDGIARKPKVIDISIEQDDLLAALSGLDDNMGVILFDRAISVVSPRTEAVLKQGFSSRPHPRRDKHDEDLQFLLDNDCFGSPRTAAHDRLEAALRRANLGA